MITFRADTVVGMTTLMEALVADGNPVQLEGRKRKVATTTATRETLRAVAKKAGVRIYVNRTGLEHRIVGNYLSQVRR